ncbi:MAG: hypothetical protein MJ250_02885 [Alphaproteobacteria bacterium]|nr:hypothetical protein [Alphaproteobacteria bacterium]
MKQIKEVSIIGAGLSAPEWLSYVNAYLAFGIAICSFIYAILRVYYLVKNKGKNS